MKLPGIGPVLSNRIVKYRESINGFKSINELKKVYGISEELYEGIRPFLTRSKISEVAASIDKPNENLTEREPSLKKEKPLTIDINTADSAEFTKLFGIGPVLAARMVKYRNSIQGFDSIAQLESVYGIDQEKFHQIRPNLKLSTFEKESDSTQAVDFVTDDSLFRGVVFDFDLNSVQAEELQKIKGVGPFYSKQIVKFRQTLGGFVHIEQLKHIPKMNEDLYQTLKANCSIKTPHNRFHFDTISFNNLLRMKIFTYDQVGFIFNLKRSEKGVHSIEDLYQLNGLIKEDLELLEEYAIFKEH